MAWGKGKHEGKSDGTTDQETRDAIASAPVATNCDFGHGATVIGPNNVKQCRRCGASV